MSSLEARLRQLPDLPWGRWTKQVIGVIGLELKRHGFGRRSVFLYLLALAPALILGLRAIVPVPEKVIEGVGGLSVLFAIMYRTFFLRLVLFFGCVGVFTKLVRGDVLERTLHYYFLTPIRREVLIVGKYLSGVITVSIIFGFSTILSYFLLFAPSGLGVAREFILNGPGAGHLVVYLGITLLAGIGYGSIFLLAGLFFRNPIVPAGVILGWEYINFLLPAFLKKISVIYYLESLCPVPIPEGPVTLLAEPAPAWLSVPGLFGLTFVALVIAALKVRHMEISYSED
jgi:ABC-type transport system involved in multi-copper enzyme maturation permease subunit